MIDSAWLSACPPFKRHQHENSFSISLVHHTVVYAESGHRNKKHRRLRSAFFDHWKDWEEAKQRIVSIKPIGKYYTLTPSALALSSFLRSGKSISHVRASTLRLETVGELFSANNLIMAEKMAELELLICTRTTNPSRNSRGTALALLALFRVQQERFRTPSSTSNSTREILNSMRNLRETFEDVVLSTFHLHCKDVDDQLRALEIYELFAQIGMNMGPSHYQLSARFWEKKHSACECFYGTLHSETLRSLGNLGHVYAAAGLYGDAEACLRQALRKAYSNRLPGITGVRLTCGRNQNDKKNNNFIDANEQEWRENHLRTLSQVYLKLQQFDHAHSCCTNTSKQALAKMYLEMPFRKFNGNITEDKQITEREVAGL